MCCPLCDSGRNLGLFRKLRSRFIANFLETWEEDGRGYIVVERGTLRVHEHAELKSQAALNEEKRNILRDAITCWLYLFESKVWWNITVRFLFYYC